MCRGSKNVGRASVPPKMRLCSLAADRWNTKAGRIRTTRVCGLAASNASRTRSTYAFSLAYPAAEAPSVCQPSSSGSSWSTGE